MFDEIQLLRAYAILAVERLKEAKNDDRGATPGEIAFIALLTVAAVTVAGILVVKMTNWANSTPDPTK